METPQAAKISELKGSITAAQALMNSFLQALSPTQVRAVQAEYVRQAEAARVALLAAPISETALAAFERDALLASAMLKDFVSQERRPRRT